MNQDEGVGPAGGDQGSGNHRLAECGGRRQHSGIVPEQGIRGSILLPCQLAFEGGFDRTTAITLVAAPHDDAQRRKQRLHLVAASARQGYVVRQQLRAADDARDSEGGQAHPLGAVELGILKRGEAGKPIDEGRGEPGAIDVYLIAKHHLDGLGQWVPLWAPPGFSGTAVQATALRLPPPREGVRRRYARADRLRRSSRRPRPGACV